MNDTPRIHDAFSLMLVLTGVYRIPNGKRLIREPLQPSPRLERYSLRVPVSRPTIGRRAAPPNCQTPADQRRRAVLPTNLGAFPAAAPVDIVDPLTPTPGAPRTPINSAGKTPAISRAVRGRSCVPIHSRGFY